jgi:nitroreductase
MNKVIELLKSHRSIRKFTQQKIEQEVVEELVRAGQSASSSSFIQACTVMQVNDAEHRSQIAHYAGDQAYVEQAPVFLVFCADMKRHQLACELHEANMNAGFTEQFITATVDCALFAQNVVTGAESLGLGTVYIGGIRNRISEVSEVLDLPYLVYPVFGLCLGYPNQSPETKPRLPLSVVLKQDVYTDDDDAQHLQDYDQTMQDYYQTRTGGNKSMGWTDQISGMLQKESRPHMQDFLRDKGFLLR